MPATLESSKLVSTSSKFSVGGIQITAEYFVNVSSPTTSRRVIELAIAASGSDDAVQPINESLNLTIDGTAHTYVDLFVQEIMAVQRQGGAEGRLKWRVTVIYRNPSVNGVRVAPDAANPPLDRADEVWTEVLVVTEERAFGKNQTAIKWPWTTNDNIPAERSQNTLGPVSNAAGFRYGSVPTINRRYPIFCHKRNVLNPFTWISLQQTYFRTVNASTWNVFGTGKNAAPRTALFWSSETSRPKYWGNTTYYELETRVLYNPDGHDIRVKNEGDKVWRRRQNDNIVKYVLETPFAGGLPQQPPVLLDANGEKRTNQAGVADLLVFRDLESANFSNLTTAINTA